jgi:hypothetical protein
MGSAADPFTGISGIRNEALNSVAKERGFLICDLQVNWWMKTVPYNEISFISGTLL